MLYSVVIRIEFLKVYYYITRKVYTLFHCKTIEKSQSEGRTRWREQGQKKPSGPTRIVYDFARWKLKQVYKKNRDFLVKMSNVNKHSDSEIYYPKKKEKWSGH